jgi:5-methylcytosine-specific restriction enzyme A
MPMMINRPCSQPGCPGIAVQGGRCAQHQRAVAQRYDVRRGTPSERGYDYEWRKLRSHVLAGQPCCVDPFGVHRYPVLATDVDHIISLRRGGDHSIDNLQPLCHACHSRKTATHDGGWGRAG